MSSMNREKLNLRAYQEELVVEANEGKNVLICAPTGSGKTVVAAHIVRNHILKTTAKAKIVQAETGLSKICFIAPTKPLVEQQKIVLERYVGDICEVQDICGSASNSSSMCLNRQVIDIASVVVVTPQIIVNMLDAKPERGYEDVFEEFKLTRFSMIIFDEAHHANDQHPYNVIMQSYHSLSKPIDINRDQGQKLPQIIALTASLGIGNSSTKLAEAIKHAQLMCANLSVNTISRVRQNVTEMKNYTSEVSDEITLVDANDFHNLGFYKVLVKELKSLEEKVFSVPEAKRDVMLRNALKDKSNSSHLEQGYENWLCTCQKNVVPKYPSMSQESRSKLMQCFDHMLIFYHAIELLRLFGTAAALSYIVEENKSFLATKSSKTTSHIQATMSHLRQQPESVSSMFKALTTILSKQFSEKNDSRVLIFALTRFQCKCLASLLAEKTSKASADDSGSNSSNQRKKVTDFDQGKTKILCVTSVAEEGLDISACNLVVQYNSITNEIAHVQRRGMSRAKKAKSVILTFDSRVKTRAELNQLREKLMADALEEIDRKPALYMSQIPEIAKNLRQAWLLKNDLISQTSVTLDYTSLQQKFAVVCRSCGAFLCYSDHIVLNNGSQHVCVDPDYLNQITLSVPSDRLTQDRGVMMNPASFRHYCAKRSPTGVCGVDLGSFVSHKTGVNLPILTCKSIVFLKVSLDHNSKKVDDTAQYTRYSFKLWRDVKKIFEPKHLSTEDLLAMKTASASAFRKVVQDISMLKIV
uniref:RNA helicase n=1 Tax=Ditylenchus dipsaci TaxID=166011 RepID=A0A915DBY6_9BILA